MSYPDNRTVPPTTHVGDLTLIGGGVECDICGDPPVASGYGVSVEFHQPRRLVCNICVTRIKGNPVTLTFSHLSNRTILPTFHANDIALVGSKMTCDICELPVVATTVEFHSPRRLICGTCKTTIEVATA